MTYSNDLPGPLQALFEERRHTFIEAAANYHGETFDHVPTKAYVEAVDRRYKELKQQSMKTRTRNEVPQLPPTN